MPGVDGGERSLLDRAVSLGLWFFCESTFYQYSAETLKGIQCLPNLVGPYLENCCKGDYKDLGYEDMTKVPEGDKPKQSMAPNNLFQDNEPRIVALIASAQEKLEMQDQPSRFLSKQKIPIVVFESTFS
ncbi:hypothetical protein ACHAPU_011515 [Fusarium lateritium]